MTRRLINLFTILSLLGCAATVALWVRSHTRVDSVAWSDPLGQGFVVNTAPGAVEWTSRTSAAPPGPRRLTAFSHPRLPGTLQLRPASPRLGFGHDAFDFQASTRTGLVWHTWRGVVTPLWAWAAVFAALPARAAHTAAAAAPTPASAPPAATTSAPPPTSAPSAAPPPRTPTVAYRPDLSALDRARAAAPCGSASSTSR